jgi:hypothetical protein
MVERWLLYFDIIVLSLISETLKVGRARHTAHAHDSHITLKMAVSPTHPLVVSGRGFLLNSNVFPSPKTSTDSARFLRAFT